MLDILGNVFGKSKKSSNNASSSSNQNGSNEESTNDETNESYVFVSHTESQRTHMPQATILTDELIRMGSSSSFITSNQPVYPSLNANMSPASLPFSSPANHNNSNNRHSLNISQSTSSFARTASPIDNVPFLISSNHALSSMTNDDDGDITETMKRIEHFVNNGNLSEYNFVLENSILRESLFT